MTVTVNRFAAGENIIIHFYYENIVQQLYIVAEC